MSPPRVPYWSTRNVPERVKADWYAAFHQVVSESRFIGGPAVEKFEGEFATFVGSEFCVGVGNGLDALTLALKGLDVGGGDVVAVPAHTFIATWLAVLQVGATPVPVDCDEFGLMDLDQLGKLPASVAAVIPVHMHGQLVDLPRLNNWAKPNGVKIIEDCAQSHGASAHSWKPGDLSDVAAYSFFPTKNLGALGDGGCITTNSRAIADKIREFANYGSTVADETSHIRIGRNSRLDAVQAALLRVNLNHLQVWNNRRREIAAIFIEAVLSRNDQGLKPLVRLADSSVWHHFVLLCEDRRALVEHMDLWGVETKVHYPRVASDEVDEILEQPHHPVPNARQLAKSTVSLPCHPWMTNWEVTRVRGAINAFKSG